MMSNETTSTIKIFATLLLAAQKQCFYFMAANSGSRVLRLAIQARIQDFEMGGGGGGCECL